MEEEKEEESPSKDEENNNDAGKDRNESTQDDSFVDESGVLHSGNPIIDASCCDAEVKYPTDIDVLHGQAIGLIFCMMESELLPVW